ncbi:unnamed protein product, partial [Musa textilis]
FCAVDGLPVEVLISGADAQKRAIDGDVVAIMLDPIESTDSTKDTDSEQEEAVRAIKTIGATMSCNPSKRPTGRVLSIIRSSPHHGAVIGLLALNPW